jgi:hypothetical protein
VMVLAWSGAARASAEAAAISGAMILMGAMMN